ncbi:non-canonical purine NTP diphosphatase [Bacteroidales bacterium OttesenSCG-928-M11]|nr:non-canonical purine NTP diphosphatase [Bacteroidales bacterium OttesenSCG-928-M11]
MGKRIVFATNNKHKLEEIRAILGSSFEILSLEDIHCDVDIPETADTLEGNALLKAEYVKSHFGCDCFADDTGLEIPALNNEPGVFSARYAGEEKSSKANMDKVRRELKGKDDWSARFRTVLALIIGEKKFVFEGTVNGKIIEEERGSQGFGYDPIFVPVGYEETFAELGNDIKNNISHRAEAINKLKNFLNENNQL